MILVESSIGRLINQTKEPFAIISAFRAKYSRNKNRARNKLLAKDLNRAGIGFTKVKGAWTEVPDEYADLPLDEVPPELRKEVTEDSFFVQKPDWLPLEDFVDYIGFLVKKYDQDAAVLGTGKGIYLIDKRGELTRIGSRAALLRKDDAEDVWTRWRGYKFIFKRRRVRFQ